MPEFFKWDVVIEIVALIGAAGGVYAAIKSDLARMHEMHAGHDKAEERIENKLDRHIENTAIHTVHSHSRSTD